MSDPARFYRSWLYLARDVSTGAVLYRRRTREYWLLLFDYRRPTAGKRRRAGQDRPPADRLVVGSRHLGRIEPGLCDLAPDGRHFLYRAVGGRGQGHFERKLYAWTALCVPPMLTASYLLPHVDTWGGGGWFAEDGSAFIWNGPGDAADDYVPFEGRNIDGVRLNFRALTPQEGADWPQPWRRAEWTIPLPGRARHGERQPSAKAWGDLLLYATGYGRFWHLVPRDGDDDAAQALVEGAQSADIDREGRLIVMRGASMTIHAIPTGRQAAEPRVLDLEAAAIEAMAARGWSQQPGATAQVLAKPPGFA